MPKQMGLEYLLFHMRFLSIVSLALVLLVACPKSADKEEILLQIQGTVTDRETGLALEGVIVDLYSEGAASSRKLSVTNEKGEYYISYYGRAFAGYKIRANFVNYDLWYTYIEWTTEIQIIDIQLIPN